MITLHTNLGDIKIQLDHEKAPITAQNFLDYCKKVSMITQFFIVLLMDL